MAADPIIYCLEHVTDYGQFERLCHDLMISEGWDNIESLGGMKDKGRDAIHIWPAGALSSCWGGDAHQTSGCLSPVLPTPSAPRCVPVISPQPSNRCLISSRYADTASRCRLGRKRWALGPYADRKRWACPGEVNPCIQRSRWRVGRWECSHRLLRERLWRSSPPGRSSRSAAP
jgi:hypothetical protein